MLLTPKFLSFAVMMALGGTAAAANTDSPAVGRALGLIQTHASAVRASANDQFIVRDVIRDANGTEHVRFDRTYGGLPVIGGDVVVHSRNGQLLSTSLTQRSALSVGTRPTLGTADAIVAAGSQFGSHFTGTPSAELVVYARSGTPVLAYRVRMDDDNSSMTYIVNAKSGKVLDSWSNNETAAATGTGKTIYSGDVPLNTNSLASGYEMRDMSHGGSYTFDCAGCSSNSPAKPGTPFTDADNFWGNNANSDRASAGADAHFGVATTWNFYATLGRNGIDNKGTGSYNRVHVGRNYVNAFWSDSCFCMSYGDGDGVTYSPLVDLDVAGHEMSHGVTSRSANLTYSGESGGLNEATSDIMGTMVEFYANNANDGPDYLIGEMIYISNAGKTKALRYMFQPSIEGNGSASSDCWYSGVGSLNVHYSSGVANHFFYMLAEGTAATTFSGSTRVHSSKTCVAGNQKVATGSGSLTGIGRDAATKIWYRALTVYMTSNTNYAGARAATLSAAADLGYSTSAVAAAWSAVGVN